MDGGWWRQSPRSVLEVIAGEGSGDRTVPAGDRTRRRTGRGAPAHPHVAWDVGLSGEPRPV